MCTLALYAYTRGNLTAGAIYMNEPFILEMTWKRRGARQHKEIHTQREGYVISRIGRRIRLKLKTLREHRFTFNMIYICNTGTHFIYITWRLQCKLNINHIDFMSRLIDYDFICNIDQIIMISETDIAVSGNIATVSAP